MQNILSLQSNRALGKNLSRPSTSPGVTYYSLLFDGTNDTASVADKSNYEGLVAGTWEWFFKTSYSASYQKFFNKTDVIDMGITQDFGGGAKFFGKIDGVNDFGEINVGVADGMWHYIAVSWNASTIEVYLDGTRYINNASAGTQTSGSGVLNVASNGSGEFLNGNLSFVKISNIKRYTGASISVPTNPLFVNDSNTVQLLLMTEGSGLTALDSSLGANNMLLNETNPPTWSTQLPF